MRGRCIWNFPNVTTKVQRKGWYSPEWTGHPAKMPCYLARTIIGIYTRPGDIILDPMSGFFTTGIEAGRLGRRCIGIEFERKYVDSVRRTIQVAQSALSLFETFTTPMIIHGDARQLPLRSADVVVTSPPYSQIRMDGGCTVLGSEKASIRPYSGEPVNTWQTQRDQRNIGNLKHGEIAAVVTSPPYSQGGQGQGKDYHPERMAGSEAGLGRGYGDDPDNIGNLRYVDACVFSAPYGNRLSDQRVADDDPQRMSYRQSLASPPAERLSQEKGIPPVTYSPHRENIGSQKGETYLSAMLQVYRECYRVLHPGGHMILVLKNFVRDMKIVRLDLDTRTLCEAVGFTMLPCPEGCEDRGHTHLRAIGQHSFWIRNLIQKWRAEHGDEPCPYEEASRYEQIQVYRKVV